MNIEFHYYINYLIALKAGFDKDQALIIAYSAQFTDDNTVSATNRFNYKNYTTYSCNILLSPKLLQKIYLCYHFLPSGVTAKRIDGMSHHLSTCANSKIANNVLDYALDSGDLYMIGIASHAYCDTWAHQNFVGTRSDFNADRDILKLLIPNIGHADYLHNPDRINYEWNDNRLMQPKIVNNMRFLDCAKNLFLKYNKFLNLEHNIKYSDCDDLIKDLSFVMGQRHRYNKYQSLSCKYSNYPIPEYNKNMWVKELSEIKNSESEFYISNWYLFQNAAKNYQKYTWQLINDNFNLAFLN